jgi:hypothetical protein
MNEPNEAAVLAAKGEVRELVPGNAEASTCLPATAASPPEPQQAAPMQPHEAALIGDASADAGELEAAPAADEAATESEDGIRDSGFCAADAGSTFVDGPMLRTHQRVQRAMKAWGVNQAVFAQAAAPASTIGDFNAATLAGDLLAKARSRPGKQGRTKSSDRPSQQCKQNQLLVHVHWLASVHWCVTTRPARAHANEAEQSRQAVLQPKERGVLH